ncbi:hypothetical protein BDQ17DRAFT_1380586, partial [Cyathus striatus]
MASISKAATLPQYEVQRKLPSRRGRKTPCTQCTKTFRRRTDKDRHVRTIHLREVVHICDICHREFTRLDALNRHLKSK